MQAEVKDAYWAIFDTDGLKTPPGPRLAELIDARISEMAARYSATYPSAMKCLTTGKEGLTAYLRFPAEHHNRVRHSNFIERTFGDYAAPVIMPWIRVGERFALVKLLCWCNYAA
jgi:putative transposase